MKLKARVYLDVVAAGGLAAAVLHAVQWQPSDPLRFLLYLGIMAVASGLKVRIPGAAGSVSLSSLAVVLSAAALPSVDIVLVAYAGVLFQWGFRCLFRVEGEAQQLAFRCGAAALAAGLTEFAYRSGLQMGATAPVCLVYATSAYFMANTILSAGFVATCEAKSLQRVWRESYLWSLPFHMMGAPIAWTVTITNSSGSWRILLLFLPLIFLTHRLFKLSSKRIEAARQRSEEMLQLHLRTTEALAAALEARNFTTHALRQLMARFAVEMGKEFGLDESHLSALHAGALLRDIGKLAVPDHIIFKPGKLTPEEFDRVKSHPIVGAEILERIELPYPVVPIVRSHHENFDGSGYPDGLRGEEIPLGARILSVVDCLEALASPRGYREAMRIDEIVANIAARAGAAFDPRVVEVLSRKRSEFKRLMATAGPDTAVTQPAAVAVSAGAQPRAGFSEPVGAAACPPALSLIAAACHEGQTLFELSREVGVSLNLEDTLAVVSTRLRKLVAVDAIVIWLVRDDRLTPVWVQGEDSRFFSSLAIPVGQGLSGWVAQSRKPLMNGDPATEAAYLNDSDLGTTLRSALCVPLQGLSGVIGVLAVYRAGREGFTKDDLRIVLAVSSKAQFAIYNALKFRKAEDMAATDCVTNLPNARALWMRLESELARSQRENKPLAIIVGDIDGFKGLNDQLGHLEGNRALREMAAVLESCCRAEDFVARMGGDEFVMILPGLDSDSAFQMIMRIHWAIRDRLHGADGRELSLTLGWAAYPDDGKVPDELLEKADRRMYYAKRAR